MNDGNREVAKAIVELNGIGIDEAHPVTFKSGVLSPVYVDNRKIAFHPSAWHLVINGFIEIIKRNNIDFDVIGGIESAGIPHSAALGYAMNIPTVFIRKKSKDHGTKKMVEGGDVGGKKVLLIEDTTTTGGSSLHGVQALREEGAVVTDCLAITDYDFQERKMEFEKEKVAFYSLTTAAFIVDEGYRAGKFSDAQLKAFKDWEKDPASWTSSHS